MIHTAVVEPTAEQVRLQLGRILSSEPFANADRLSRFLRYVVERSLAGEGDRLKEYVIGTEVFDRGERYDPRLDSIVRVEAGRLRAKLEEYYNRHGSNDAVIVRMARGGYAPSFERRQPLDPPATRMSRGLALGSVAALIVAAMVAWGAVRWSRAETRLPHPTIAVLPIKTFSTDERVALFAARVTDGVTSELARLGTVRVVSHTSAIQFAGTRRPLKEIAQALGADVVMEASVTMEADRMLAVQARLVDAVSDRKFWVEEFTAAETEVRDLQRRIAAAVAGAARSARTR